MQIDDIIIDIRWIWGIYYYNSVHPIEYFVDFIPVYIFILIFMFVEIGLNQF